MGLDMYLTKKTYVGANYEHRNVHGVVELFVGDKKLNIHLNRINEIVEMVGYWRKANAIHQWFVNNVQDGKDNCREYWVSKDKLTELLNLVNKVLDSSKLEDGVITNGYKYDAEHPDGIPILETGKVLLNTDVAENILPTTNGFFFGGTDYDQYYIEDLKLTKEIIEPLLLEEDDGEIYYRSSW